MRVVACITARMSSSRLPGKALIDIAGKPAIERIVNRFEQVRGLDGIVVATTADKGDDPIVEWCVGHGVRFHRGSTNDVCQRIYAACLLDEPDYILRGLGDCTFVEPSLQEMMLDIVSLHGADAARISMGPNDCPVYGAAESPYSWASVQRLCAESSGSQREHFGTYLDENRNLFDIVYPMPSPGYHRTYYRPYRLELDTEQDLELMRRVYKLLGPEREPALWEVIALLDRLPALALLNASVSEKTGPLTTYSAKQRREWVGMMEHGLVDWSGDWSWLQGNTPDAKAVWCSAGKCYLGYKTARGELCLPDGTRIVGKAELSCACGAGYRWFGSKPKRRTK